MSLLSHLGATCLTGGGIAPTACSAPPSTYADSGGVARIQSISSNQAPATQHIRGRSSRIFSNISPLPELLYPWFGFSSTLCIRVPSGICRRGVLSPILTTLLLATLLNGTISVFWLLHRPYSMMDPPPYEH